MAAKVDRYMAPAMLPNLPSAVRRELEQRGCLVPLYREGAPETVLAVRGAFYAAGLRNDWAIACSREGAAGRRTTILAFAESRGFQADSVAFGSRDSFGESMPREDDEEPPKPRYFSFEISLGEMPNGTLDDELKSETAFTDRFTPWERRQPLHDGISFEAGASMSYYWTGKRWVTLPGAD
jgi:hypothetical protein